MGAGRHPLALRTRAADQRMTLHRTSSPMTRPMMIWERAPMPAPGTPAIPRLALRAITLLPRMVHQQRVRRAALLRERVEEPRRRENVCFPSRLPGKHWREALGGMGL